VLGGGGGEGAGEDDGEVGADCVATVPLVVAAHTASR